MSSVGHESIASSRGAQMSQNLPGTQDGGVWQDTTQGITPRASNAKTYPAALEEDPAEPSK